MEDKTSDISSVVTYRTAREEFFARFGHLWPGTLAEAFDILDIYPLSKAEIDEIRSAAAGMTAIYKRAADLLRNAPHDTLHQLGIPPDVRRCLRTSSPKMEDCVVGRFDLARTDNGYKMLEFNSDSPGLIVEAFSLNGGICRAVGKTDPNRGCHLALAHALSQAVSAGLHSVQKTERDEVNVVVTSVGRHSRDRADSICLAGLLQDFRARYIPCESLAIDASGLYDPDGKRIDVLYRNIPLQFIRDTLFRVYGDQGPEVGGLLLKLVASRRLSLINPPFSCLLENKAVQAVIWTLFEAGFYFNTNERQLIWKYMLPVYLDPPGDERSYVIKPVMGAEGDSVTVVNRRKKRIRKSRTSSYADQPMVYQEHVDLPQVHLMTEYRPRNLHLVHSCFVTLGVPSAICCRAGGPITNEEAWVLPVCSDL